MIISVLNSVLNLVLNSVEHKCNRCGYNKYPDILQVHHKNRDRENNTINNLELLCPNCHLVDHLLKEDGIFSRKKGVA